MSTNQYPEPAVGALIFNKDNKVFLMTSPKWNGRHVVPGGHIEIGETIEEAVIREVKEETNLDVTDLEFVGLQDSIFSEEFNGEKHFVFIDYVCKAINEDVVLNKEGTAYIWVSIAEALKLPLAKATRVLLERYAEIHKELVVEDWKNRK